MVRLASSAASAYVSGLERLLLAYLNLTTADFGIWTFPRLCCKDGVIVFVESPEVEQRRTRFQKESNCTQVNFKKDWKPLL